MDGLADRILTKLAEARATGVLTAFGADRHHYVLRPPLEESVVVAFEERHEVVLPAAYRFFLTEIGDGGAGPGLGIIRLDELCRYGCRPGHLRRPSPYLAGPRFRDDWEQRHEDAPGQDAIGLPGTVPVAYHGCSLESRLIVTGTERGRVLNLDPEGPAGPYLVEDENFLAWYERWLDEAVAGYDVGWFGERLPLSEPELIAVLADDPSPQRRERAADSLTRLPVLTDTARAALVRAAEADNHPGVRAAAFGLLCLPFPEDLARHARAVTPPDLRTLGLLCELTLDDVLPELAHTDLERRRHAAYALAWERVSSAATPQAITDVTLRMLADPDPIIRAHGVAIPHWYLLPHLYPRLQDMLGTESDPWVRHSLDWCLSPLTRARAAVSGSWS